MIEETIRKERKQRERVWRKQFMVQGIAQGIKQGIEQGAAWSLRTYL